MWVEQPVLAKNAHLQGKSIREFAAAQGKGIIDAFLDLVVEEHLDTVFLLGYWVREQGIMPLEQAVRRLTFESATAFGIYDRRLLRPGMVADVTIFDRKLSGRSQRTWCMTSWLVAGVSKSWRPAFTTPL
jgi:N-acyl-D-aspartate/D-glutamate deacylase